ncbi:Tat pathway signal sequence domain protein [Saccharothrix sp. ALI-22-I]|uniref:exo-rhamnogalacturonan lyase family protein n=1 Tax=Saccharothrix sp. ALI-22-I TaxID=1933778 RepID=UPI00097C92C9|nr:Tat pathway signal sequence domain protein [Saccharothrix sp. ALI-22-I]ONI87746.1 Tat pathway signal sequence domain protein [Saccharothrix sp. ALI-22-I]
MAMISRRDLLLSAAAVGAVGQLGPGSGSARADPAVVALQAGGVLEDGVQLRWLEGGTPRQQAAGCTWGVPWPKGAVPEDQPFALRTTAGQQVPVQTWATAYWPDGSLKWTAHAIGTEVPPAEQYVLAGGVPAAPAAAVTVKDGRDEIEVNTGVIRCVIPKKGDRLVRAILRGDREIARNGELICLRQDEPGDDETGSAKPERFTGRTEKVTVESSGPVRAVVKIEGGHRRDRRSWLPFTVRLYFYAGSDGIRAVHSFVFDGNEKKDFVRGLGIRFEVPMRDEPHNRHVRFAGPDDGVLSEAVRGITGLRRDPGAAVRRAQVAGQATPPVETWDTRVSSRLHLIPTFGDYSLRQLTADGFQIRKRTKAGHGWIPVDAGGRAGGLGYVGGPGGGFAFGMRNFWQLHPTQLDIRGAAGDKAEVTVWLWSPDAGPMDLRFYHDGLGQDTYPEQLEGLEITYEDYEPGFGTPYGIARTTELMFWALDSTPAADRVAELAQAVRTPPLIVAPPAHLHAAGVFGDWSPVDRSTPAKARIEDRLDFLFDHHSAQVEQRSWYGFWDYGDIMHSYDPDRHVWRYDVGGYAWDNSELSTDLWLWYHYLRTGQAEAFRFAEAMTRHTGEVDVYHLGKWQDLGTRHGVQHWADSAKQVRISNAGYRRFLYFLTADERTGDLLRDLVDADRTFLVLDPIRKIRTGPYEPDPHALGVSTGTDWSGLALAWLTEWERGGAPTAREKLLNSMRTIAAMPNGFARGSGLYDLDDGTFKPTGPAVSVGSLGAVFGLVELCSELVSLTGDEAFTRAWLQYCRLYNGTAAEQQAETGQSWGNLNLRQAHSRLTAYAAAKLGDATLAARAWKEFDTGHAGYARTLEFKSVRLDGPQVLKPVDEAVFASANASAQYGLAAIQCLALVGDRIPS